jgi:hypothetical protein
MFIQLKAAFLLIVFYLNMIIGFACAVGVDMWFNTGHHKQTELLAHEGSHGHNEAGKQHKSKGCKDNCCNDKDNCCNDHVIKFAQVEKSFPKCFAGLNTIFFTTLISSFCDNDFLHTSKSSANTKYFVQGYHPPITDIRITIQSFQI